MASEYKRTGTYTIKVGQSAICVISYTYSETRALWSTSIDGASCGPTPPRLGNNRRHNWSLLLALQNFTLRRSKRNIITCWSSRSLSRVCRERTEKAGQFRWLAVIVVDNTLKIKFNDLGGSYLWLESSHLREKNRVNLGLSHSVKSLGYNRSVSRKRHCNREWGEIHIWW